MPFAVIVIVIHGGDLMPRKGENIYKRKDGRWEGRYVKGRDGKKAIYGYPEFSFLYGSLTVSYLNKSLQAL